MCRIDTFIVKISQDCLPCRVMTYRTHELTMKPLARKSDSCVGCPTARTKFNIINVSFSAKLKFHKLLMNRPVAHRCKFVTMTQEYVLDCSANCKHTRNCCHYTIAFPTLPKALIFSSTTTWTAL
ncbi:hypothetical protein D3C72_1568500 [compost metagenome]